MRCLSILLVKLFFYIKTISSKRGLGNGIVLFFISFYRVKGGFRNGTCQYGGCDESKKHRLDFISGSKGRNV